MTGEAEDTALRDRPVKAQGFLVTDIRGPRLRVHTRRAFAGVEVESEHHSHGGSRHCVRLVQLGLLRLVSDTTLRLVSDTTESPYGSRMIVVRQAAA